MDEEPVPLMRASATDEELDRITGSVVDSALAVHRHLGPGLLERVYRICLAKELHGRGHHVEEEVAAPIVYEGVRMDGAYRMDLLVDRKVLVEVKSVEEVHSVHTAQVFTYLKLSGTPVGLLLNFNVRLMKQGIKRVLRVSP